ncbi:SDR family NAD(P)-dependent oxidoreductase [Actinoallomurus spadix]|uniref:PKS/mFAS DH domain-containing protein n=1 Tax=Actinoallomurus spadix TaxID=79912 RepID=A0ABP3GQE1_9ACTN|nr:SDR family NAD(P)-dependent oxidoreductase [Actinoallomurus spadix]MCO5989588.1 SDR family NAD(P)-dependent oxidoreductase [Actinoallomurus spadix]
MSRSTFGAHDPTFLGGEGGRDLIAFLTGDRPRTELRLRPDARRGERILRLRRPDAPSGGTAEATDGQTAADGSAAREEHDPATTVPSSYAQERHVITMMPTTLPPGTERDWSFESGAVVLTEDAALLDGAGVPEDATVIEIDGAVTARRGGRSTPLEELESGIAELLSEARPRQVCVVVDLGVPRPLASDTHRLLRLHDATFLAARECAAWMDEDSSFFIVLLRGVGAEAVPHPYSGLFTGLAKALSADLPGVRVLAVAHDADRLAVAMPDLRAEAESAERLPAVYYVDGRRIVQHAERRPARRGADRLNGDSVVVAAGGGRGIGAEMLKALAERFGPRIYVLGSNPIASYGTEVLEEDEASFAARKRDFLRARSTGPDRVSVKQANAEWRRMAQAREVHATLAALQRHSGADRVTYIECDLRAADAVSAAVGTILAAHGQVDLLLNIAGINRAAAVRQKSLADFQAVRDLKFDTYTNLKRAFATSPPREWCNSGSATGFAGQRGETDYSAANDFLTSAAMDATANGHREYTIGWSLWGETGLATDPLMRSQLAENAELTPMTSAEAIDHFLNELTQDPHVPGTVLLGVNELRMLQNTRPHQFQLVIRDPLPQDPPGVGGRTGRCYVDDVVDRSPEALTVLRAFDLARDGYLEDHLVSGHPTLPGMLMVEIGAQAAVELVPHRVPVVFEDVRFERFLRVYGTDGQEPKRTTARLLSHDDRESVIEIRILSDVISPDGRVLVKDRVHGSMRVHLRDEPLPAPLWEPWPQSASEPVSNPYYAEGSVVRLSGTFASTRDGELHSQGNRARLALDRSKIDRWFPDTLVPAVCLDALAQVGAFGKVASRWSPIAAPLGMRRIDVYDGHTDSALARAGTAVWLYSVPGHLDIDVRDADAPNRSVAADADGRMICQLKDVSAEILGYVDQESGEFIRRERVTETYPGVREPRAQDR